MSVSFILSTTGHGMSATKASMQVQPTRQLTNADHASIAMYVRELRNEELFDLGVTLGLRYTHMTRMAFPENDIITAWLREDDDVQGPPTWASLVKALEENGHQGLAQRIRQGTYV